MGNCPPIFPVAICMERQASTIYRQLGIAPADRRIDGLWVLFWLSGALLLYTWQLGDLPLSDGGEGQIAVMARALWRSSIAGPSQPYHPPLMPWLIGLAYRLGGVSTAMTRLPSALLSAVSVPLLYWIGREMFYRRLPAIFAAAVYLTYLPVLRQGRLATLDGALLCLALLMWGCLLRSRRDQRWSLGVGGSIGLMGLMQGWMGLALGAIGILFLLWDTPRILRSGYFWLGLGLGAVPIVAWYGTQYVKYSSGLIQSQWFDQFLSSRVFDRLAGIAQTPNATAVWFYGIELVKYGTVWLLFIPLGLRLLGRDWHLSWAKLLSLWFGSYFLFISLLPTKLPGYALPLYPPIALLVGVSLTQLWEPPSDHLRSDVDQPRLSRWIPAHRLWATTFLLLTGAISIVFTHYLINDQAPDLVLVWGTLALTLLATTITLLQQSRQFILVLIWGVYLSLLGFVSSDHWVWELADRQPVQPIAAFVKAHTRPHQIVYTTAPNVRPSLAFYSDRSMLPLRLPGLTNGPLRAGELTVLVPRQDLAAVQRLPAKSVKIVAQITDWAIVQVKP
jgi:4-amino-4-deoxy-L-arabinose transferase-like glycosyltransferase